MPAVNNPTGKWQTEPMQFAGTPVYEDGAFGYVLTGDYKADFVKAELWRKDGEPESSPPSSVHFVLKVTEAANPNLSSEIGKKIDKWLPITQGEKGGAKSAWKLAYLSMGVPESSLPPTLVVSDEHFAPANGIAKSFCVHVDSPPFQEGVKVSMKEIESTFLRPETYAARKASAQKAPQAPAQAPMAQAPMAPMPALPPMPQFAGAVATPGLPQAPSFPTAPAAPANGGGNMFFGGQPR